MLIGCPKETAADEKRVALTPDSALQIQKLGYSCVIEAGAGDAAGFTDAAYEQAGVTKRKPPQIYGHPLMLLSRFCHRQLLKPSV